MTADGFGLPTDSLRLLFSRHLIGDGIELGPGHHPYVIRLPATTVQYVDRWTPEQARELFPELGADATFVTPDVIANVDAERLSMFDDQSQDFVIASHVLEHVANPLAMITEINRVLRPGGIAVILLPDLRRTSDRFRQPTTLEHLIAEYEQDVRAVDDAHLRAYALNLYQFQGDEQELKEFIERLALRSIHVHAWTEEHFFPVLDHAVGVLDCDLDMLELLLPEDITPSLEFGYVLRRSTVYLPAAQRRSRLSAQRDLLLRLRTVQWDARSRQDVAEAEQLRRKNGELTAALARHEAVLGPLRRTPLYPAFRLVRRTTRRLRASQR